MEALVFRMVRCADIAVHQNSAYSGLNACVCSEVSNEVNGAFGNILLVNIIEACHVYHIYAFNTELR